MFFEKLLLIKENEKKLQVDSPSEFRKKIFDELLFQISTIQKHIFVQYASKLRKIKIFAKHLSYHNDCLEESCLECPQCKILNILYNNNKN